MDRKFIVALELSGTQVRGAVASVGEHHGGITIPTIEAIVSEDNPDCVQYGRVQNLVNAAKCTSSVIQSLQHTQTLDESVIKSAYVGLGGRSLGSEQTTATIELPTEMEITSEILRGLFVDAAKTASPNKKVLKVLPRKYVVDNQSMPNPVGALGRKLRGDFTVVTCNPTNQRNLDLVFNDRVNINVEKYIVTPLAVADMVIGEEEKQLGCALVDVGAQTTTISIYKDRALQYLAVLPIGSHNITRDISLGLNMTLEKAENLKCSVGDALYANAKGTDETSKANSYVVARAYELVVNIIANIGYAGYDTAALPGGFILTGRGARLKNFDKLLANQSKMMVRFATLPSNVHFSFNTNNIHPDDYLTLIAIVMRVNKSQNFVSCVAPKEQVVEEPEPPVVKVATVVEQPKPAAPAATVNRDDDNDDNWQNDDLAPDDEEKKADEPVKKKGRGFFDKLKDRFGKLIESDGLENDTQI